MKRVLAALGRVVNSTLTGTLNGIIQAVDPNASIDSVIGGFLDMGSKEDRVKDGNFYYTDYNDKYLLEHMSLCAEDIETIRVTGNEYKIALKDCSNPQKDNSTALDHATNDFITVDEIDAAMQETGASFEVNDSSRLNYQDITITAIIKNGLVTNLQVSYTVDVNLSLKIMIVNSTGTGKIIVDNNYSNFDYSNVPNLPEIPECPWESHDTVCFDETVEPSCTSAGYDVYWCDTCQRSFNENYVTELDHNFENGTCTVCNVLEEDCIETEHDYSRPCDLTWTIHKENATSITITFSNLTMTASYDRIDIYDGEDNLITIGDTWGGAMSNATMTVMGDTVKIRFTAYEEYYGEPVDYTAYGFKIINVVANYDSKEGWVEENGKWAFYENGVKATNKWLMDSVGWCYVGADGYCVTNCWKADSKGWCYLDANGRMVYNNWVYDNGKWYFMDANGYMVSNQWRKDSKGWCYLGSSGAMLTNAWVKDSVGWCYVGADGYCVTNKWVADSKGWCYLDSNGRMVTNKWVKDSKGWCYVGANGYCLTNTWKADSKGWCYLDADGRMVTNKWIQDGGKWYYLDANGYMVTGTKVIGGKTYKFASNGVWIA